MLHVCVCASVHVRVERGNSQNKQKTEFFQKMKSTSYTSYPSITTINLQNISQLIKKKSLFEPIFQEDPGHNVSVLLLLRLCQGITSWLVQEAEKIKVVKKKEEDTKSPLRPVSPTPKTFHTAPLLTCLHPFPRAPP